MTTRKNEFDSADVILHRDHYSPEELADLLNMTVDHVRFAIHNGRLHAISVDHRIISIRREDVLTWLESRAAPLNPAV